MNETTADRDQTEEETFAGEVSDDALEAAAETRVKSVSMGAGSCWMPGGGRVC